MPIITSLNSKDCLTYVFDQAGLRITEIDPLSAESTSAAAHKGPLSLSAKTRNLQLRSRQISHRTTICKVGDLEYILS
jgi:hypothetical protein